MTARERVCSLQVLVLTGASSAALAERKASIGEGLRDETLGRRCGRRAADTAKRLQKLYPLLADHTSHPATAHYVRGGA